MTKLVIIGAGEHGAVVADAALLTLKWSEIVFLDDKDFGGETVLGIPVVGRADDWVELAGQDAEFFVAIGGNARRLEVVLSIESQQEVIVSIVHPSAVVSPFAIVDPGVVVCAGAVINPRATIGRGSIVNTGATVDHDCVIKSGAHISPGANLAGGVCVGDRSWIGIGASVREGVTIGRDTIVGAGAAVVSDIADGETVGGVPARALSIRNSDD